MDKNEHNKVVELIEELWPRARTSVEQHKLMYWRFKGLPMVETLEAFRNHYRDNLDATSPTWNIVIAAISRGEGDTKDAFRTMLDQIRRHNTDHGSAEWSDERAFAHHLAMATYAYRQNPVTKTPREDEDGSLAKKACDVRQREFETWRSHFEYAGREAPAFLGGALRLVRTE